MINASQSLRLFEPQLARNTVVEDRCTTIIKSKSLATENKCGARQKLLTYLQSKCHWPETDCPCLAAATWMTVLGHSRPMHSLPVPIKVRLLQSRHYCSAQRSDAKGPGCVKTFAREEGAKSFSLLPSLARGRERFLFFKLTMSRRNFYSQIQLRSFHTAWAMSRHWQHLRYREGEAAITFPLLAPRASGKQSGNKCTFRAQLADISTPRPQRCRKHIRSQSTGSA